MTRLLSLCFAAKGVAPAGTAEAGDLLGCRHTAAEHPVLSVVPTAAVHAEQVLGTTPV